MLVHVGSTNPVKIQAVNMAFNKLWPDKPSTIIGRSVASGVSTQPMTDEETMTGALNRAKEALKDADYSIGIEGGLHQIGNDWYGCGWVAIINQDGEQSLASSARIQLPPKLMQHIHQGLELGKVNDLFFGITASKSAAGHFGLMTSGHVTRNEAYQQAIIFALSRYVHADLYR